MKSLRFILPRRLGEGALFEDISETEVRQVLEEGSPQGDLR